MNLEDKIMLTVFGGATLGLLFTLIGAEPVLVARLNGYLAIGLALSFLAIFFSLFDLYRKAKKKRPVRAGDVLRTAALVMISAGGSLSAMTVLAMRR